MDCNCEFAPYDKDDPDYGEKSWHYRRECANCGRKWLSTHCKHDGVQYPCPRCGFKPLPAQNGDTA